MGAGRAPAERFTGNLTVKQLQRTPHGLPSAGNMAIVEPR